MIATSAGAGVIGVSSGSKRNFSTFTVVCAAPGRSDCRIAGNQAAERAGDRAFVFNDPVAAIQSHVRARSRDQVLGVEIQGRSFGYENGGHVRNPVGIAVEDNLEGAGQSGDRGRGKRVLADTESAEAVCHRPRSFIQYIAGEIPLNDTRIGNIPGPAAQIDAIDAVSAGNAHLANIRNRAIAKKVETGCFAGRTSNHGP